MGFKSKGFTMLSLLVVLVVSGCSSLASLAGRDQPTPALQDSMAELATTQAADTPPSTPAVQDNTEAPATTAVEDSTEAPVGKLAADKLPCPQDAQGMQFFADEANGFCLLVPDGFTITRPDDSEVAAFAGTPGAASGSTPLGYIIVGDAQGKTAAEIAAPVIDQAKGLGMKVEPTDITLGGEQAVMVDNLPGQDVTRKVFVVHGGTKYELSFTPSDPNLDTYPAVKSLYDAVIGSFAFLR